MCTSILLHEENTVWSWQSHVYGYPQHNIQPCVAMRGVILWPVNMMAA